MTDGAIPIVEARRGAEAVREPPVPGATEEHGSGPDPVPVAALAKSVGRVPNVPATPDALNQLVAGSQSASLIGAALDLLIAHDPRPNGEPSSE